MKVIVHIGTSKTGTSALQTALRKAAAEPETWPVCYPTWPEGAEAHHTLASAFVSSRYLPRLLSDGGRRPESEVREDGLNAWVNVLLQSAGQELVVISSEYLFGIPEVGTHELARLLGELSDDVEIVCYVRPPAAHYVAALGQRVRASRHVIRPCDHRADLARRLGRWADAFEGRVTVRSYDRDHLVGGDVIEDFRTTFLPQLPPLPRPGNQVQNRSLSAEAICLLHDLRRNGWVDEERQHSRSSQLVQHALLEVDDGPSASTGSLVAGVADAITWAHDLDLRYLEEHHGMAPVRREPPAEPCPAWTSEDPTEILAIDPDRLALLRARLLREISEQAVRARDRIERLEARLASRDA